MESPDSAISYKRDSTMTNPTGSVFISYRRSPARPAGNDEATLVCDSLRRAGVPIWRDLDDLAYEPTEEALVAAIEDPSLSGAILLISPEVETSPIVRHVEAVRIFRRYRDGDGFWVLPVLIDLDYGEADVALGSPTGFQHLGNWNMYKIKSEMIGALDARAIAQRAVKARLQAIREMDEDGPLSIGVFARRPPAGPCSLVHDFSAQFHGRKVDDGGYAVFEAALLDGASRILKTFPSPRLVGEGAAPLPLGVLVGAVYSPRAKFKLSWSQFVEDRERQQWSFDLPASEMDVDARVSMGDPSSEDLVLAIGLSADIEHAVAESLTGLGVAYRACLHCAPRSGSYTPGRVLAPEHGVGFVLSAVQRVRDLREELAMRRANLHVFLACPLAMAVLFGQKLNTFSDCHLYEHDPDARPSYTRVHTFQPSSLVYE